ncbi:MAG: DUF4091 domain-containing protein [Clostridia bacterium]|nr:DUF4091 domain-containing protein [Clostridia bacterium]
MRKKIVLTAVVMCLLGLACLCLGGCKNDGGNNTMWFETPTKKVLHSQKPGSRTSYTVYMAADEKEGCQAVLKYQFVTGPVEIEVAQPENKDGDKLGVEVFAEGYVQTTYAEPFFTDKDLVGITVAYPDGLKPVEKDLIIPSNEATPFYILFDSENAKAGDYSTEFIVKTNGEVIDSGKITVHVWNFSMPKTRTMTAVSDLSAYCIAKTEKIEGEKVTEMYVRYYEFLLDHNICAYSLPYDILDGRVDRFLDDPRVTQFRVPYSDDDTIRAYYAKLSQKEEWLKKAYFYPLDEPADADAYNRLRAAGARLESLFPGYRMVVPFFIDPEIGDEDGIDYAEDYMNIWCPKLFCFDEKNIYSETLMKTKAPFAERMKKMVERGDDLWWYVCWEPGDPYANLYVNMEGVKNRSIFWQAELYGVNGFLYWSSNYWDRISNPWEDANTVNDLSPFVYGDGSLLYSGRQVGVDGPCSSLRLEAVRDGIDDYELIVLAKQAGASDAQIKKIVNIVAKSITDYSTKDDDIVRARRELAKIIEKSKKG